MSAISTQNQNLSALNILMVSARYFPLMGGTETHTYEVARRIAEIGHNVTILTTDPSGKLPAREEKNGVNVIRVRAWPVDRDYYFAPTLYPIIARGNWDVVHCQGYHTLVAPLAMLAANRAKIPYVLTFHSGGHSSQFRSSARGMQRQVLRPLLVRAAQLIGVSRFEADFFSEQLDIPRDRFTVIQNGAQLPTVPTVQDDNRNLIVSLGRLERYKGHQHVISAMPHVLEKYPDAHLRIVGSGPYEAALRELALELGIADKVEIGAIPPTDRQGMASLLMQAKVVTLLSDYEAHPVAVMEALSLRRPVLVTDSSGFRELAEQGLVRAIPLNSSSTETAAALIGQIEKPLVPPTIQLPTWEGCVGSLLDIYRHTARTKSA